MEEKKVVRRKANNSTVSLSSTTASISLLSVLAGESGVAGKAIKAETAMVADKAEKAIFAKEATFPVFAGSAKKALIAFPSPPEAKKTVIFVAGAAVTLTAVYYLYKKLRVAIEERNDEVYARAIANIRQLYPDDDSTDDRTFINKYRNEIANEVMVIRAECPCLIM